VATDPSTDDFVIGHAILRQCLEYLLFFLILGLRASVQSGDRFINQCLIVRNAGKIAASPQQDGLFDAVFKMTMRRLDRVE
jgi:hypothetical protein